MVTKEVDSPRNVPLSARLKVSKQQSSFDIQELSLELRPQPQPQQRLLRQPLWLAREGWFKNV